MQRAVQGLLEESRISHLTESNGLLHNHEVASELVQQAIHSLIVSHARAVEEKLHGKIILEVSYQEGIPQYVDDDYKRRRRRMK